jgi:type III secretion system YscQ/HrcQ family protein
MAQRPALERVSADAARLATRMFTHRAHSRLRIDRPHAGALTARWRWHAPDREIAPTDLNLVLASADARCSLALHGTGHGVCDDAIDLGAFAAAALREAAALRHAVLLDHLEALTGRAWDVVDVDSPALQEQGLRAAFTIEFEGSEPLPVHGEVCIAPAGFAAWRDLAGDPVDATTALSAMTWRMDVLLGDAAPYARGELLRLRSGGALLLQRLADDAQAGWPCWLRGPQGTTHALARLRADRLTLRTGLRAGAPPTFTDERSTLMTPSSDTAAAAAAASTDTAVDRSGDRSGDEEAVRAALQALPVALEFRIGQLNLTLAEMSSGIAPGRVFELGHALGPEAVSVRSGGVELARGELIEVGDRLAVRIARLSAAHGSLQ